MQPPRSAVRAFALTDACSIGASRRGVGNAHLQCAGWAGRLRGWGSMAADSHFWAQRRNVRRNGRSGANEGPSRAKHPTRAFASTWRRACAGCSSGHKRKRPLARHPAHPRATSHGTFGLLERGLVVPLSSRETCFFLSKSRFFADCCELLLHTCVMRAATESI